MNHLSPWPTVAVYGAMSAGRVIAGGKEKPAD